VISTLAIDLSLGGPAASLLVILPDLLLRRLLHGIPRVEARHHRDDVAQENEHVWVRAVQRTVEREAHR
jgi:hypothetical protein